MYSDEFAMDCKYWIGYKPCKVQKATGQRSCSDCKDYTKYSSNVLVIEVGGLGSVLRTACVIQEFNHKGGKVQLVTNSRGVALAENISAIDKAFDIDDWKTHQILESQKFDVIVNFDSSLLALSLAKKLKAKNKRGFIMDDQGNLSIANKKSLEFLRLQTDDIFRIQENQKSMQQILLETAGFSWREQRYHLITKEADDIWAERYLSGLGIKEHDLVIGLNIGSSVRQKKKRWPIERFFLLVKTLDIEQSNLKFIVLAGPDDVDVYNELLLLERRDPLKNLFFTGYSNSISQFISLVNQIPLVVSCDTFGLHVAIALNKKVISLNGPQPIKETEVYGLGEKIGTNLECSPCFLAKKECSAHCMQIDVDRVFEAVERLL